MDETSVSKPLPTELIIKSGLGSHLYRHLIWIRYVVMTAIIIGIGQFTMEFANREYFHLFVNGLLVFLLLTVVFSFTSWIPRQVAVLDSEGIRFVDSVWFAFQIRIWVKVPWNRINKVKAVRQREWKGTIYCQSIRVSTMTDDFKDGKSFELPITHPDFFNFLSFLKSKLDPSRFDQLLLEMTKDENRLPISATMAQARSWGWIVGLIASASVGGSHLLKLDRSNQFFLILSVTVILGVVGWFRFRRKS